MEVGVSVSGVNLDFSFLAFDKVVGESERSISVILSLIFKNAPKIVRKCENDKKVGEQNQKSLS